MSDNKPIIEFSKTCFSYGDNQVLRNVDLVVRDRDSVLVLGPNGGGKTTLLRLVLGLLSPSSGSIKVFGNSPAGSRSRIGYMPQYAKLDHQFPVSVRDVVLMGRVERHWFGPYHKQDREAAESALAEVGMAGEMYKHFDALSGGQKQRVLIARALASDPELLLLDEPTANVDPAVEEQFYETVAELNKRMAVLMVTHDIGVVSSQFKHVFCVNRDVHVHPTSELSGDIISEIYGCDLRLVHHHHDCPGDHIHE